jgi:hypothetical protein
MFGDSFGGTNSLKEIGEMMAEGMRQALKDIRAVDHYGVKDREGFVGDVEADDYSVDGNIVYFWRDGDLAGVFLNPIAFWPVYADPEDEEE